MVTNFWAGPGIDELAQGRAAVQAARAAGVEHFVWSTLPNVALLSNDAFEVPHFTQKARVDAIVSAAGFPAHTFVEPPFYFQNLSGQMGPQPQADGSKAWVMPMAPESRVIHAGDVTELGTVVAGALAHPGRVGAGQHLALSGDLLSWNDIVKTLNNQGHNVRFQSVPGEVFDNFFPQAKELREMMNYFEAHTYFGPDADKKIALAREVATAAPTSFADWARANSRDPKPLGGSETKGARMREIKGVHHIGIRVRSLETARAFYEKLNRGASRKRIPISSCGYDARNGTSTNPYNAADQLTTMSTPAPGGGYLSQTTTTSYDNMAGPGR